MDKSVLERAYIASIYITYQPSFYIKIGEIEPNLNSYLINNQFRNWAFITACNPLSNMISEYENTKRMVALEKELIHRNFKYYSGIGEPDNEDWQAEESFLIVNITLDEAKQLALQFEQNAFVFGSVNEVAELVWLI